MKKLLIFSFLFAFYICNASAKANPPGNAPVNRHITSETSGTHYRLLPHDTCLDKKFSIVFYIIQDSVNSLPNNPLGNPLNYIATYSLAQIINTLNAAFAPICVSFENCKTVIIPNYSYNKWNVGISDSVITGSYYTPQTINIYLPTTDPIGGFLNSPANHPYAYCTPVPTATSSPGKDYIVGVKAYMLSANGVNFNGSYLLHAMGHFFGLVHTNAEITTPPSANAPSQELVNGSNSTTNGDGLADTEADPYPNGHIVSPLSTFLCEYNKETGVLDANNQYYTPPVDNIMSLYNCRCKFTQEQYNSMAHFILTRRLYLH